MTGQADGDGGGPPPVHRFVEHTGEVVLEVRAGSWSELLEEAARGLGELQLRGHEAPDSGVREEREVALEAADEAALLVDWLNDLIYLAETERAVVRDALIEEADEHHLRAAVRTVAVAQPPALVKAATLHGLHIAWNADGVAASVVLDI